MCRTSWARVVAARSEASDRLAGLRRIGIDEISYRKGHRDLLVGTETPQHADTGEHPIGNLENGI